MVSITHVACFTCMTCLFHVNELRSLLVLLCIPLGFRRFCASLNKRYIPPSWKTCKRIGLCAVEVMRKKKRALYSKVRRELGSKFASCSFDMVSLRNSLESYAATGINLVVRSQSGQLKLLPLILNFKVFPFKRHTAKAIKCYLRASLKRESLSEEDIRHWTPDGASNGKKALKLMNNADFDVCTSHDLQRCVKYATGKTKPSKNPTAAYLLRRHKGMVSRLHRSLIDTAEFTAIQEALSKDGHSKQTVTYAETRWDGELDQVKVNNTLREPLTILFSGALQEQVEESQEAERACSGDVQINVHFALSPHHALIA